MQQTARRKPGEDNIATNQPQSDWVRIPAAQTISSVSRSTLYANFDISGGAIKTASIRRRGATRGIRMVSVSALLAWLDSYVEEAAPNAPGTAEGVGKAPSAPAKKLNPNHGHP